MDFYKYIPSIDVQEHLKEMNFELNTLQCLWIIAQSDYMDLGRKTAALEHILTMPDYKFKNVENMTAHRMINEYFKYVEETKKELIEDDDNSFYTGFIKYEWHTSHLDIYFKDYQSCLEHIKEEIANSERCVVGYKIHKIPFNTDIDKIEAEYYIDGELLLINKCGPWDPLYDCWFESKELKFACPFKAGDILYDLNDERPVVLKSISDDGISADCYYVSDDEKTLKEYWAEFFTSLEYYTHELTGKDNALYAVNDFIKGKQMF